MKAMMTKFPLLLQESMAELPEQIRKRFRELKLPPADVLVLADELAVAQYFDAVLKAGAPPKAAANWVMGDVMGSCKVGSGACLGLASSMNCWQRHCMSRACARLTTCIWAERKVSVHADLIKLDCLQESKTKMSELKMAPSTLAEMILLIEDGTISGKIGKQILPRLLQVG